MQGLRRCLSRAAWWLLGVIVGIVGGIALAALLLYIKEDKGLNAKTKRLVIHIPFGLLLVLGARLNWALPVSATALFIFYERDEDHWIRDQAWKDVAGALWGMGLGILIWAVWRLLG